VFINFSLKRVYVLAKLNQRENFLLALFMYFLKCRSVLMLTFLESFKLVSDLAKYISMYRDIGFYLLHSFLYILLLCLNFSCFRVGLFRLFLQLGKIALHRLYLLEEGHVDVLVVDAFLNLLLGVGDVIFYSFARFQKV